MRFRRQKVPGPVHSLPPGRSATDFLNLFFTDDVCEALKMNISKYTELCESKTQKNDVKTGHPFLI